jgi:RNA polymerase sigma factor (sigma-70 family)
MNPLNFNTAISGCRSQLMQSALQFTQNTDDADDLVQETMFKAIRYENKFQEGTNIQAWLFTILRNTFINNYKAMGRRASVFVKNVDPWSYPVTDSTARNQGEGKLISEDVHKALADLDKEYAVPFLRYFEGYHYHEIAHQLGLPLGTVKTRIHVARRILKNKLKMYA